LRTCWVTMPRSLAGPIDHEAYGEFVVDFNEYYLSRHPNEYLDPAFRWHPRNPVCTAYRFQLERTLLKALSHVTTPIEHLETLDVGCGTGRTLRFLVEIGVPLANVHGVDLLPAKVAQARAMNPSLDVRTTDASSALPFPDDAFDLVTQLVVLSSVPEPRARAQLAREMVRVLRPGGWVISYDVTRPRPGRVPDGIPIEAHRLLFDDVDWVLRYDMHNVGLARLARWPLLAEVAERLPLLPKTNVLLAGKKRARS